MLCLTSLPLEAVDGAAIFTGWRDKAVRFSMPVTWSVTRSDLNANDMSSQTETFRETWTLELDQGFEAYISSPRARIPVAPSWFGEGQRALPKMLIMTSQDLAGLLGVPPGELETSGPASGQDLIPLSIAGMRPNTTETFSLKLSKDQFCSVEIGIGG